MTRRGSEATEEASAPEPGEIVPGGKGPTGKGRATPKRRDAETARRQRMAPPKNRKEAAKRRQQKIRAERVAQRAAMMGGGDQSKLPARDRGPVRKFVRDFIDSRRSVGEFLLPILVIVLLLSLFPATAPGATLGTFVLVIFVVIDSVVLSRKLKRELAERYPDEEHRGATMYLVMRSLNIRKMRLPKPRVKPGEVI